MAASARIDELRRKFEENPRRFFAPLANEYRKAGRREDEAATLTRYLDHHEDEGNAYGRLGEALRDLGREREAREAFEKGIRQAERHGHSGMAEDLRAAIEE